MRIGLKCELGSAYHTVTIGVDGKGQGAADNISRLLKLVLYVQTLVSARMKKKVVFDAHDIVPQHVHAGSDMERIQ